MRLLLIALLFLSADVSAQPPQGTVQLSHYVLDTFYTGTVLLKTGKKYVSMLNYNVLTNEMIFEQGGERLAIADTASVDTIFIQGRKFIPSATGFYEVLANTALPLYAEYHCTVIPPSSTGAYGMTSETSGNTAVSTLQHINRSYNLKLPDDYKVKMKQDYFIKKEDRLIKANNAKQLEKLFPGKENLIKDFIKAHQTDFLKPADVAELVKAIQV